jgi:hypothetical protein
MTREERAEAHAFLIALSKAENVPGQVPHLLQMFAGVLGSVRIEADATALRERLADARHEGEAAHE